MKNSELIIGSRGKSENNKEMSYLLQSTYIKILNPIYALTGRINENTRNRIIFILFLVIFLYLIFYRAPISSSQIKEVLETQFEKHLFGCVMLILLTIISINKPLTHVKWRYTILIPQLLLGAGMVVVGFIHPIGPGYQITGFMLIFLFPCLYFVWNNRGDYDRLFSSLSFAMIVANMFLVVLTVYYALQGQLTFEVGRCIGIMNNSNGFSLVGLELVLGAMYLLLSHQHRWVLSILLSFVAGIGLGIIIIGQMRIAVMILFVCFLSAFIFCMRNKRKTCYKKALRLLVGAFFILQGVLFSLALVQINYAVVASEVDATQETTQETIPETTQPVETPPSPSIVDRFDIAGQDANSFSSGRVAIWKNYANKLNLLGNNRDNYNIVEMTGIKYPYAHNVFLEVGYRCGVPIGILAVIVILIPGLIAIRYVFFKRNAERYLLFPIFAILAYALEALLDCAFLPFFQAEALCYYLALAVFIDARS